jgi:RNA polymerase sigma-70 factor (ECF subfamily)
VAQDEWKRRRRDAQALVSISDEASGWEERLQHPGRNAEELMEEREFAETVEDQLQRLSLIERAVLVLYHQEERTYEQIALALGLPIGTVRTHLHRGRKKLREGIEARRTAREPVELKGASCASKG